MSEPVSTPPAGGFGAPQQGQPTELVHHAPNPPRASYGVWVLTAAVACFVALIVASGFMFAWKRARDARSAEARYTIGEIAKDAQQSYALEQALCPSTRPVPADFEKVRGHRYQSAANDWREDPGWACVGFESSTPQRYQYRVETSGEFVTITATGDLDGDDVRSQYSLSGHVDPKLKKLVFDGAIHESNRGE